MCRMRIDSKNSPLMTEGAVMPIYERRGFQAKIVTMARLWEVCLKWLTNSKKNSDNGMKECEEEGVCE